MISANAWDQPEVKLCDRFIVFIAHSNPTYLAVNDNSSDIVGISSVFTDTVFDRLGSRKMEFHIFLLNNTWFWLHEEFE